MSIGGGETALSAHVRYGSREAVIDALFRAGTVHGTPVPVWPPRRLPLGLFVSPVREGWVSLWSPLGNLRDWFPELVATLECPGIILEGHESGFWTVEFLHARELVGRYVLPTVEAEQQYLWDVTYESLHAEGVEDPEEDEGRFSARLDEIAASDDFQEEMEQFRSDRPEPEDLLPFLPAHASLEQAWELLTAMDREEDEEADEEDLQTEDDYMDAFASYLGIRDAAWIPGADAEALADGDYEDEEGLPEGWREFLVLPIPHLPVL